ncbi:MAG TPA: hypothetical protein VF150_11010 [Thermoanaerobaculia bacterium]
MMAPPVPRWRVALLAAVLPPLLLGFLASALANRLAFAGWAVAAAALTAFAVRSGFEARSGPGTAALAAALLSYAPALALFGWLAGRHREVLDLGGRAVLGDLHAPAAAAPATWYALAAAALIAAATVRWRMSVTRRVTRTA